MCYIKNFFIKNGCESVSEVWQDDRQHLQVREDSTPINEHVHGCIGTVGVTSSHTRRIHAENKHAHRTSSLWAWNNECTHENTTSASARLTTSSSQPSPTLRYFSTCTVIIGANQRGSQAGRLASAFWVASHTWKHQGRQTRGTWTSLTCSLQFLNLPLLPKEQLGPFWFNFSFLGSGGSIFPNSSQKFKN